MSQPNLWFLPRAFFPHGGHGGGELPVFPAPSGRWRDMDESTPRALPRRGNANWRAIYYLWLFDNGSLSYVNCRVCKSYAY